MYQQNYQSNKYNVDLVMCIDGTGSMKNLIENVKNQARAFYHLFKEKMIESERNVDLFRVRVIVFRDFNRKFSAPEPMEKSPFYNLAEPEEKIQFENFIDNIEAKGGGDDPENGLEAIAEALKSEWYPKGGRFRRQAIIVFTDTGSHDLHNPKCVIADDYPRGIPQTLDEMREVWEKGDQELAPDYSPSAGRMIIFAPDKYHVPDKEDPERVIDWAELAGWESVVFVPVQKNGGCEEIDLKNALNILVGSVAAQRRQY